MQPDNNSPLPIGKVRMKCRRGMLELDMILQKFLEKTYEKLSPELQLKFYHFLDEPDPVLYDWLLRQDVPEDKSKRDMINLILK